jgi:hypothetical protein
MSKSVLQAVFTTEGSSSGYFLCLQVQQLITPRLDSRNHSSGINSYLPSRRWSAEVQVRLNDSPKYALISMAVQASFAKDSQLRWELTQIPTTYAVTPAHNQSAKLPYAAASSQPCSWAYGRTLLTASTDAPAPSNCATTSLLPFLAAACRGVAPSCSSSRGRP